MGSDKISLCDVLAQLGTGAVDNFVRELQQDASIKSVRQACRGLRHIVDSSICSVALTLSPDDLDYWDEEEQFPLRRWIRCNHIDLDLEVPLRDPQAGTLLALPFTRLQSEARHRITSLQLSWADDDEDGIVTQGAVLAGLMHSLPALRRVDLATVLDDNALGQHILYDALASLPHLEELELVCSRALSRVDLLSSSGLRHLTVYADSEMNEGMVSAMGRLRRLNRLSIHMSTGDPYTSEQLLLLMQNLPPAIHTFDLVGCPLLSNSDVTMQLDASRITSIEFHSDDLELQLLVQLLSEVLLPSGLADQGLDRISLAGVLILAHAEGAAATANQPAEPPPLETLLRRCKALEVGVVSVDGAADSQLVRQALDLLCRGVNTLRLQVQMCPGDLVLRLRPAAGAEPPAGDNACAHEPPASGPGLQAGAPALLDLVMERMVVAGSACGGAAAVDNAGRNPDGTASKRGAEERIATHLAHFLLLRGPLLPRVTSGPWGRSNLNDWVRRLAEHASGAARLAGSGWHSARSCRAFFTVPDAAGCASVLVHCNSIAQLSAVEAAANLVASMAAATNCAAPSGSAAAASAAAVAAGAAAAAGTAAAAAQLQVQRAAVRVPAADWTAGQADDTSYVLLCAISQAAHSVWTGDESFSAGWGSRQRLSWLLEQWLVLKDMPPPVFT